MKVLITGASGFLGGFVVSEALERGHNVRAVVRSNAPYPHSTDDRVETVSVDLRTKVGLKEACDGVDVVLHLAASKSGDIYAQYAGTVVATENLLEAMTQAGVRRIVGISSFAVYDYRRKWSYSSLNEHSKLEAEFPPRDEYSHTKLVQERLIREHALAHGWDCAILRPGVIYGPENLWTARLGMSNSSRRWVRIGSFARLPLSYVENCAQAIVMAAEQASQDCLTLNVLDDACPTQSQYANEVLKRMHPRPRSLVIPWWAMRILASMASLSNRLLFRSRAKLPAILVPAKLHARFKPLTYSNQELRKALGWMPRYSLAEALDRSFAQQAKKASTNA